MHPHTLLQAHTFTSPSNPPAHLPPFLSHTPFLFPPLHSPSLSYSCYNKPTSQVVKLVRFVGPVISSDRLNDVEDSDLVVETCITRVLPPALTLQHGLESIKEAVEKLKANPPCRASGFLRFLVAVPPAAGALNWFCHQPSASQVFPLFFISKEVETSFKSIYLHDKQGIFGIGAAAYFIDSSSCTSGKCGSVKRYLTNDSTPVKAYGFLDINLDMESLSMKREAGSCYFFIPQIELDEHGDVSILAAMMVWSESPYCTFEEALLSFERSLAQATSYVPQTGEKSPFKIGSTLRSLNMEENDLVPEVYSYAIPVGASTSLAACMELKKASSFYQFLVRLSQNTAISRYMFDPSIEKTYSASGLPNINAVWTSLIIEECCRLGLTYFCIAPGSRSSPLALAASRHPLITCIACFDERSLAYHAVGYARGSHRPAVLITTSGTAVSNLLPAVVEASQDFVPVLLLTADRPSELQDAGANQSINQVNHFGSFVRHFFSLPEPSDLIPARMVLTTIDSAVYLTTSGPCGPVHVNCHFREPLDDSCLQWESSCLEGLGSWFSNVQPFTKYIQLCHSHACVHTRAQLVEVLKLIKGVDKGLLLFGAIHSEDDIWAALLLANHLLWPVVADILSGLRLRRLLTFFPNLKENVVFIDHLDHALISHFFRNWLEVDGVIQIGSKITSKRVAQMLEKCSPCAYIMVDEHPCRHDPSHMITHRIQSTIIEFVDFLLQEQLQHENNEWNAILRASNNAVAQELLFQIVVEHSLTEPQVALMISKALSREHALFIGNSMAIRDVDMYGHSWAASCDSIGSAILDSKLPCQLIQVAGNRGASGIDGLLSTAVGFAVGCNKRVVCLMGDISFLHDTNGLAILSQRASRKPMTIIVINNHGGAIFSLLPVANNTDRVVLNDFFCTSHNISVRQLCFAHGVKHVEVHTKEDFEKALYASQNDRLDCLIEVESCIDANTITHSNLRRSASQAAEEALQLLLKYSAPAAGSTYFFLCNIMKMEYFLYRIPLRAAPTSSPTYHDDAFFYREGFILYLTLEDGSLGLGEVAPLEIHEENLTDAEEQLRFLCHVIRGTKISNLFPLMKDSFSSWIWNELHLPPSSIFPSVRCGLEMAILNAIARAHDTSLLDIYSRGGEVISSKSLGVQICALLDPRGTPEDVAQVAAELVEEGFSAIKLKVARGGDPLQDAANIQEIRKKIGNQIELRADANRKWTCDQALQFASSIRNCNLQYIEEPVQDVNDIIKFCEESGIPVALDETVDLCQEDPLRMLMGFSHPGIVAIIIKPSMLGGFEKSAVVARWAQHQGKMAVVSSTFESGIGLSAYVMFSSYLDLRHANLCKVMNKEMKGTVAHGIGTYQWLKEDVASEPLNICRSTNSGFVEASVNEANRLLQMCQLNEHVIIKQFSDMEVSKYDMNVDLEDITYSIKVLEVGEKSDNVVLFLHGFLGSAEEWLAIMKTLSGSARCISIDLPGHGDSRLQIIRNKRVQEPRLSIGVVADLLCKLLGQITSKKITLVGYSMGARIALYMAMTFGNQIEGVALISGSPGLKDVSERKICRAVDDSRAQSIVSYGLQFFVESWYSGRLWKSLRNHPQYNQILATRLWHNDVESLAKILSDLSVARQPSLWEDLKQCKTPILLVVGKKDRKFTAIAQQMYKEICSGREHNNDSSGGACEMIEVPDSGHAVHVENPLPVARALRKFLQRVKRNTSTK